MARTGKNFRPSKWQRKFVWAASVAKFPQDQIAAHLGVDGKTLRKWFPQELNSARMSMIAESVEVLQHHLGRKDRTTAIYLTKALAGWRDQGPSEETHRWTLEEIEAQIAFIERTLGVKPGENPSDAPSPGNGAATPRPTAH